ncbi:hypothetical protein C1X72_01095 [Pseudomonas sp. FW306-2-2C-D06B]|nr:hypothetical protein C1X72_01095 [Pseudomonas sp. FW306-2-2C-D06B]PNB63009.1 hypothetical protein C1X73_01505 [Pseudomonas sp. FW305-130]
MPWSTCSSIAPIPFDISVACFAGSPAPTGIAPSLGGNTCGSGRARERAGPGSPNPQSYR